MPQACLFRRASPDDQTKHFERAHPQCSKMFHALHGIYILIAPKTNFTLHIRRKCSVDVDFGRSCQEAYCCSLETNPTQNRRAIRTVKKYFHLVSLGRTKAVQTTIKQRQPAGERRLPPPWISVSAVGGSPIMLATACRHGRWGNFARPVNGFLHRMMPVYSLDIRAFNKIDGLTQAHAEIHDEQPTIQRGWTAVRGSSSLSLTWCSSGPCRSDLMWLASVEAGLRLITPSTKHCCRCRAAIEVSSEASITAGSNSCPPTRSSAWSLCARDGAALSAERLGLVNISRPAPRPPVFLVACEMCVREVGRCESLHPCHISTPERSDDGETKSFASRGDETTHEQRR